METHTDALIVILGLSDDHERYSNRAYNFLKKNGFNNLIGVAKKELEIPDIPIKKDLSDIDQNVHTLTVYVNPTLLETLYDKIIELSPKRVIFNPGSGNQIVQEKLAAKGIEVINGCTLVMLSTKVF